MRYLALVSSFTSSELAREASFLRLDATFLRHDATLLRRNATVSRTFVSVAKSDLRQIAFHVLTACIRVGEHDVGRTAAPIRLVRSRA